MNSPLISKKNDCRSCYKCIRACPTKSITFHDNQASILPEECILCGRCYVTCPQGCKIIRSDKEKALSLLQSGNCRVSLAPSYVAAFPGTTLETMEEALLALGAAGVEETAIGATIVKKAYDEMLETASGAPILTTCCPAINELVRKYYPECAPYLAPVLSPMLAHGKDLKERYPGCSVLFIGPCIAKKGEADKRPDLIDCVLTYDELIALFEERNIEPRKDQNPRRDEASKARLFPTEGGILATMERKNPSYEYVSLSGMEECMGALEDLSSGTIHHGFFELSACEGSCINGPVVASKNTLKTLMRVRSSAGKEDFKVRPHSLESLKIPMEPYPRREEVFTEEEIARVLSEMGKRSKKDELNCASCGYPTCRDKAKAVLQGKASVSMCLPFLMEKATSFSNDVIEHSPNAIVVVDESLNIQLANPVFAEIVGHSSQELIGTSIADVLEPTLFIEALEGRNCFGRHIALDRYSLYVEATVRYDETYHIVTGTFRDRTQTVLDMRRRKESAEEASKVTREVIEKNMRAVQEIAELLGQSAAETKVALTRLSSVLSDDGKNHG